MSKKLRANDDLRTRFRPTCQDITYEKDDGVGSLGVFRDGDQLAKQNRNPSVDKLVGTVDRSGSNKIRKSRRTGCPTPPSVLTSPGKVPNLTALPQAPGEVNNLTAAGSLFLIPGFNFNHAAMSANQSIIKDTGVGRFKNSAGFGSNAFGLRATKWSIELSGWDEAPIRSDDGLGGTVNSYQLGQQEPLNNGSNVHDGSWCLSLNTTNHEGFRATRNTFAYSQHVDKQTYFIVLSTQSLVGRYRWQAQTNLYENRFPIFGTHESSSGIFGVDLTLINDMKDLAFRIMDEDGTLHETAIPNFTPGIGHKIPVTLITLQVNYNSTEDSSIFINGHKVGSITSRGEPAHIVNNQYRVSSDSISFAEGATVGFGIFAEPDYYTRLNLHELGHLDAYSRWWNDPQGQTIAGPVNEKGEGYLAHKWHIDHLLPTDHPYKNKPPAL